jgi:hypothetical protein
MMRRFGIDPAEGVVPRLSMAYMTAVHRCQACRAKDDCRRWLDSTFPPVSIIPSFCSNEDILFELRVNHPGRAKAAVDYCACIADLERFVNEINETLLDKAADDQLVSELKSRKSRLCDQILRAKQAASKGGFFFIRGNKLKNSLERELALLCLLGERQG